MNQAQESDVLRDPAAKRPARRFVDLGPSWAVFQCLVITAAAWFLLKELAPLLRPLLLAVLLAYVILPVGVYVKGQFRGGLRHVALLIGVGLALATVGVMTYGDIINLGSELPRLHQRLQDLVNEATRYASANVPRLTSVLVGTASVEEKGTARLQEMLSGLLNATAGVLLEAFQVFFYLIFILLEAGHIPRRMRQAFAGAQADQIFSMVGSVNEAIASYLKVQVNVSIALAAPVMIILWALGIKYVLLWGVLTFLANFIPYLGSVVACAFPITYALLDKGLVWQSIAAAVLLIATHVSSAYVVQPAMTGKAVNLTPLVVLIALTFWGLCWGLVGLVLAVPLTVLLKIVLERGDRTRPYARLMGEE
jgi:AI-2 transport protein TqsA